ncbi:MAG: hypothetical protein ACUVWJ_12625 [Spirochaetota bacterium]
MAKKDYELLYALRSQEGETIYIYLIVDNSKKDKRGKKIEATGWVYDPLTGKQIWGHHYVKATILFRGYTIPFGIILYVKKEKSSELELEFKKLAHLEVELNGAQKKE